jgi:hypothetical protein
MSDWSSFTEDKELADAWRDFLQEAPSDRPKTSPGRAPKPVPEPEEEAPPEEAPEGDAPEGDAPEGDAPEGDAPEGDAPEGGGGRGASAKQALGNFAKMFRKKPGEFLPSMKPDWKGISIGKLSNLGSTSGQRARRQLALMGDIDLSGIKGSAPAAATDSAGSETAAKPASKAFQELTNDFLNPIAGGVATADDSRRNNAAKILYKSLTPDEQKKIAAQVMKLKDPLPLKLRKILGITGVPPTTLEQIDLSLEDLIKEELLRVLNEKE